MTYTFYDSAIPPVLAYLDSLTTILKLGEAHADAATFPETRLYPDMLPLSYQVHIATDFSSKFVSRFHGTDPVVYASADLKTYEDFYKRIDTVRAFVAGVDKEAVNAAEGKVSRLGLPDALAEAEAEASLAGYFTSITIPNVAFHVVTAYNILRSKGVGLGKYTYLAPFVGIVVPKKEA